MSAIARGESCRSVAAAFDVSVASVVKWSQQSRATGSPAAKRMGGNRPYLLEGERNWLLARFGEKPDLTLHALLAELRDRGVVVSPMRARRSIKPFAQGREAAFPAARVTPMDA